MNFNEKIYVAGHLGMVGSAIVKQLHLKDVVGYDGEIKFNTDMPDGTSKKLLDTSKITKLGWKPTISFKDGLHSTYNWFLSNNKVLII